MPKYGKLILEGLGVVLAASVIIFFVGTAHSSSAGVNAQANDPNPGQSTAISADSNEGAYACPMHPDEVTNDPNGKCPIWGMKVELKDQIKNNGQMGSCPMMRPGDQSQDPNENSMHNGMHH